MREEHRFGRHQRHAIAHRLGPAARLPHRLDPRQLGPAVHARHFPRFRFDDGARPAGQHDDIGQIIFARRIIVADLVEQHKQVGRSHRHQPAIAQGNGPLAFARILILDHLLDDALPVGDDPAIGRRIVRAKAQHHRARLVAPAQPVQHRLHRARTHQRHVAVKDQHIARESGQRIMRLRHRMPGAQLRLLHRDDRAGAGHRLLHLRAPRAHDHHLPLGRQFADARQQVQQHGSPRNRMQNLVKRRFHPRPLPGGKDDDGQRTVAWTAGGTGHDDFPGKSYDLSFLCHVCLAFATAQAAWQAP